MEYIRLEHVGNRLLSILHIVLGWIVAGDIVLTFKNQKIMIRADKVAHFVVSLILTIVLAIVIKSVNEDTAGIMCGILAGIVTMCIGVAKEVWDKFRGTGFDLMDLAADLGGCVVAVIFSFFM